jgi:hypothetical protein
MLAAIGGTLADPPICWANGTVVRFADENSRSFMRQALAAADLAR